MEIVIPKIKHIQICKRQQWQINTHLALDNNNNNNNNNNTNCSLYYCITLIMNA